MKNELREKIAGEIALSSEPGKTIRKWREAFHISQQELSKHLKLSPSVISDYESGRRKSPGTTVIRRLVDGLLEIDEMHGAEIVRQYSLAGRHEAILSIKDFSSEMFAAVFIKKINGKNVTPNVSLMRNIHGYTVIDSIRAITTLAPEDYLRIYGWSSERALIFTGVKYGRSPMIAIKTHPLKPAMVVYHQPAKVDDLAIRLAEMENIALVITHLPLNKLIERLEKMGD